MSWKGGALAKVAHKHEGDTLSTFRSDHCAAEDFWSPLIQIDAVSRRREAC